jgi:hypothetical protein
MTLQEYFATEFAEGKVDHWCRAHVHAGVVEIYIHPHGRDGQTTPALVVEGNAVRPKYLTEADVAGEGNAVDVVAIEAHNAAVAAAVHARELANLEAALVDTVDALEAPAS